MKDLVASIPSGIPAPDSNLQIGQVKQECGSALAGSQRALKRLVDFVLEGIVPDDLGV